jgi:MYXO-CTERM domain-containing protein
VPAHTGSATQTVKIQNCNATAISLGAPMFATMNATQPFGIVGTIPTQLGPGESTTFVVAFQPTAIDRYVVMLTLVATDSTNQPMALHVTLVGQATGGTGGDGGSGMPPTSPASFYACSCTSTDGVGGALVVLAVAVAIAPRRRRRSR